MKQPELELGDGVAIKINNHTAGRIFGHDPSVPGGLYDKAVVEIYVRFHECGNPVSEIEVDISEFSANEWRLEPHDPDCIRLDFSFSTLSLRIHELEEWTLSSAFEIAQLAILKGQVAIENDDLINKEIADRHDRLWSQLSEIRLDVWLAEDRVASILNEILPANDDGIEKLVEHPMESALSERVAIAGDLRDAVRRLREDMVST